MHVNVRGSLLANNETAVSCADVPAKQTRRAGALRAFCPRINFIRSEHGQTRELFSYRPATSLARSAICNSVISAQRDAAGRSEPLFASQAHLSLLQRRHTDRALACGAALESHPATHARRAEANHDGRLQDRARWGQPPGMALYFRSTPSPYLALASGFRSGSDAQTELNSLIEL